MEIIRDFTDFEVDDIEEVCYSASREIINSVVLRDGLDEMETQEQLERILLETVVEFLVDVGE